MSRGYLERWAVMPTVEALFRRSLYLFFTASVDEWRRIYKCGLSSWIWIKPDLLAWRSTAKYKKKRNKNVASVYFYLRLFLDSALTKVTHTRIPRSRKNGGIEYSYHFHTWRLWEAIWIAVDGDNLKHRYVCIITAQIRRDNSILVQLAPSADRSLIEHQQSYDWKYASGFFLALNDNTARCRGDIAAAQKINIYIRVLSNLSQQCISYLA